MEARFYRPEWEEELLSLEKVCTYLAEAQVVPSHSHQWVL